jgi:protein TonB
MLEKTFTRQIKVAFVVQIDGTLKDFKIIEGLNSDMNVEALRVLFNSPCGSWKSGW